MLPMTSGTTTERIVRTMIPTLLFSGLAGAFLWDGFVGYARDNAEKLVQSLGLESDTAPVINTELTAARGRDLAGQIGAGDDFLSATRELGPPAFESGDDAYYVGPAGHLRVRHRSGRVENAEWVIAAHSESELTWQRGIGYVLSVVGFAMFLQLVRVLTLRVALTEDGLSLRGRPAIPFDAMTALRPVRSGTPGLSDLEYSIAGRTRSIRLDDYVIKEYQAIIEAICERAGLSNPHATASDAVNDDEQSEPAAQ